MASFSTFASAPRFSVSGRLKFQGPREAGAASAGQFLHQRISDSARPMVAVASRDFCARSVSSAVVTDARFHGSRTRGSFPISSARLPSQRFKSFSSNNSPFGSSIRICSFSRRRAQLLLEREGRASQKQQFLALSDQQTEARTESEDGVQPLVGEDAGVFNVKDQKTASWTYFTIVLGVVLAILYVAWLDPNTGFGGAFIDSLYSLNSNHEVVMLEILFIFALVHSGGASLRAVGEKLIGERAYRVLFAGISLPLAVSAVVYFINHRYDGTQLWQLRTVPGVHEFCWILSFVSFFFLYPSTFNLLEVAAVDKPKFHMYETGIMRITRHPQMVGQLIWCIAHTLWIGNSFTLTTSLGLLAHHLFGVWHGDRRLAAKYGEAFEIVRKRTSVIPFASILEGRQVPPPDFYKEFVRLPYFVIVGLTLGTYFAHPLMQYGSHILHW